MLKVHIKISGDKETIARLNKVGDSLNNWTSTLTKVGDLLQRIYEVRNFETVGAYIGTPWAALKPSTIRHKAKQWPGRDILQASGSMQHGWDKSVKPTVLSLFNTASYARWHQTGTRRMVARPLVDINQRVKNDIIEVFRTDLAEKLQKAFK